MTQPSMQRATLLSDSPRRTEYLGRQLGGLLRGGEVVCLSGDMGAGKTVFSRGIGAGWGASIPLTSPTFNLAHEHSRGKDDALLYHLDCYRLCGAGEADTMGFDDMLDSGAAVILEWPERIKEALPAARLWIDMRASAESQRICELTACGGRHIHLLSDYLRLIGRTDNCLRRDTSDAAGH